MIKQFCFVGDASYINDHLLPVINSVETNNPGSKYHIITNAEGVDLEKFSKISTDITVHLRSNMTENFNRHSPYFNYLTDACFLKLYIPECVKTGKVCYLDLDIICNANLDELFDDTYTGHLMAVPEPNIGWNFKRTTYQFDCFNSGVLLFDCDKINLDWVNVWINGLRNHKRFVQYKDGDQLTLYQMYPDYIRLPYKYNVLNYLYQKYMTSDKLTEFELKIKEQLPSVDEIKLIHYSSAKKPWNCEDLYLREFYDKYKVD